MENTINVFSHHNQILKLNFNGTQFTVDADSVKARVVRVSVIGRDLELDHVVPVRRRVHDWEVL